MMSHFFFICSCKISDFSVSHRYKSNTSSSLRTMYIACNLDKDLKYYIETT